MYEKGVRVLFVAGGTAGHIVPAINIANRLRRRYPGSSIFFVGTESGMESILVPRYFPFQAIKAYPFRGGIGRLTNFLVRFPGSVLESIKVIKGLVPDVVVGTGGYVSAPVIVAAKLLGIPTLIQVQNVTPGLASRFLSFFADEIAVAFPATRKKFFWRSPRKVILTGNPVNVAPPERIREDIINEMNLHKDFFTILVTGGSQGSRSINNVVLSMVKGKYLPDGMQLIWQTGRASYDDISKEIELFTIPVYLTPFIERMNEAYAISSLIVCRAGALTLSEVAAWGLPSIVIPYRGAGRHQAKNAKYFAKVGASVVIKENELSAGTLSREIIKIYHNEQKRVSMIRAARRIARENGTDIIVDRIIELVFKRR
ncbi:MAG: undecaprenyldiphospho-muramoylpentapeptide beta-N-acetylglucosaminyltransferase [bacterium]